MTFPRLTIGLVRRGHSETGGAETYLKRLARGLTKAGHTTRLFTDAAWPTREWPWGPITRLRGETAQRFADELVRIKPKNQCDLLFSLERVWSCDVYRAGDGIHKAWIRRRVAVAWWPQRWLVAFKGKHRELLELEASLFRGGAGHVVANSQLVKNEAEECYSYPADRITVVPNGVPVADFCPDPEARRTRRESLDLGLDAIAVLFVGSGGARKGLHHAVKAIRSLGKNFRLLVAGRVRQRPGRGRFVHHLGPVRDLAALYSAADIFLLPTLYDPFSNACLEALAAGLPVVTTQANGFSEIMQNEVHGTILETPVDLGKLRAALSSWADPERRKIARPKILERASHFDISVNVEQTLAVLTQAARAEAVSGKMRKT